MHLETLILPYRSPPFSLSAPRLHPATLLDVTGVAVLTILAMFIVVFSELCLRVFYINSGPCGSWKFCGTQDKPGRTCLYQATEFPRHYSLLRSLSSLQTSFSKLKMRLKSDQVSLLRVELELGLSMVYGALRGYFYTGLMSSVDIMCQLLPSALVRCHGQHTRVAPHRFAVLTVLVVRVPDFNPRTHVLRAERSTVRQCPRNAPSDSRSLVSVAPSLFHNRTSPRRMLTARRNTFYECSKKYCTSTTQDALHDISAPETALNRRTFRPHETGRRKRIQMPDCIGLARRACESRTCASV